MDFRSSRQLPALVARQQILHCHQACLLTSPPTPLRASPPPDEHLTRVQSSDLPLDPSTTSESTPALPQSDDMRAVWMSVERPEYCVKASTLCQMRSRRLHHRRLLWPMVHLPFRLDHCQHTLHRHSQVSALPPCTPSPCTPSRALHGALSLASSVHS